MGGREGLEVFVQTINKCGLRVRPFHRLGEAGILFGKDQGPVAKIRDSVEKKDNEGAKDDEQGEEGRIKAFGAFRSGEELDEPSPAAAKEGGHVGRRSQYQGGF